MHENKLNFKQDGTAKLEFRELGPTHADRQHWCRNEDWSATKLSWFSDKILPETTSSMLSYKPRKHLKNSAIAPQKVSIFAKPDSKGQTTNPNPRKRTRRNNIKKTSKQEAKSCEGGESTKPSVLLGWNKNTGPIIKLRPSRLRSGAVKCQQHGALVAHPHKLRTPMSKTNDNHGLSTKTMLSGV